MNETALLAVNGTLMRGLELNHNLLAVGATFVRWDQTAPCYRSSIGDRHPGHGAPSAPGARVALGSGTSWSPGWPESQNEPPGLAIGRWSRNDGSVVWRSRRALPLRQREITSFGSWRAYTAAQQLRSDNKEEQ
jgi:hypothetical protein